MLSLGRANSIESGLASMYGYESAYFAKKLLLQRCTKVDREHAIWYLVDAAQKFISVGKYWNISKFDLLV